MKKLLYIFLSSLILVGLFSCEDQFLLKPIGSDATVDSIFSTSKKSEAAIARAYAVALVVGLPGRSAWDGAYSAMRESTQGQVAGEDTPIWNNWIDGWLIPRTGMNQDAGNRKAALTEDGFNWNYNAIRTCYLVMENIDKVSDMSEEDKAIVKAEMKALVAYRYQEMFKRYGGVPIVKKTLAITDTIQIPRPKLQTTLDFIIKLCDEATQDLPDAWPAQWRGRVTKGVALAIKAEALIYAARPLFNSPAPVLPITKTDYLDPIIAARVEYTDPNEIICFMNYDPSRWQKAADAAKAVIDWSLANGYEIIDTDNPLDDYGMAVAQPNNTEMLLAYKYDFEGWGSGQLYQLYNYRSGYMGVAISMTLNQLLQYRIADGTDQDWPELGEAPRPFSDFLTRMEQMEPRYKEAAQPAGMSAWNNPNDVFWSAASSTNVGNQRESAGRRVKYYWRAGTRTWFDFPIYRLAEFYLDCAEAYNELDQTALSLQYLNKIRNRGGIPDATETNKDLLRQMIQREWRVEFFDENHNFADARHWKRNDIDKGMIGGDILDINYIYAPGRSSGTVPAHYASYFVTKVLTGYWAPNQYLLPFYVGEVNKGYLVQNPGY